VPESSINKINDLGEGALRKVSKNRATWPKIRPPVQRCLTLSYMVCPWVCWVWYLIV